VKQQRGQGYIPTLDGWRAIAIIAVVLDHAIGYGVGALHPRLLATTRIGQNGVSLFFAISGFLICSRLIEEEKASGKIGLGGFYIRRASRILPAALVYLAILGALGFFGVVAVSSKEWWASVFFYRNYLPPGAIDRGWGGYTIHYWSLAVEEHFYFLWPAILLVSGCRRAKWAAGGLAILDWIWRLWESRHGFIAKLLPGLLVGTRTDVRISGLIIGCLAALILANPGRLSIYRKYVTPRTWALCVAGYIALQFAYRRHNYTLLESILLASIVSGTVALPGMTFARLLEMKWMRWIGRLSYSIYLWQQFFLVPGAKYPMSILQRFPVNLLALIAVAGLSYRYIERPMIRIGHVLAPPSTPGRDDSVTDVSDEPAVMGEPEIAFT
jgi:peptidoglycan/LPS O-acetylase OafA/YrhL